MTEEEQYERGRGVHKRIHGSVLTPGPRKEETFSDIAMRNIYNEIWGREVMSVRDRRLMVIGALAGMTLTDPLEIHLRSAIDLKELTWEEIDEIAVALSPSFGAPKTT